MSTRSCVARRTDDGGWEGRYVHFDGDPGWRMPALLDLIDRDGVDRVLQVVIDEHPNGWSALTAEDETLGKFHSPDRFEVVPGYGIAYLDGEPSMITSKDTPDCFIEWVYIVDSETITVLEYEDGEHKPHSQLVHRPEFASQ